MGGALRGPPITESRHHQTKKSLAEFEGGEIVISLREEDE